MERLRKKGITKRSVHRLINVTTAVVFALAIIPTTALAAPEPPSSEEAIESYIRGTPWYDPTAGICTPPTGSGPIDASEAEIANAKVVIGIAKTLKLGQQGALIGLMTALTESNLQNYANSGIPVSKENPNWLSLPHDPENGIFRPIGSDHDSVGIMQQRVSTGWSTYGNGPTQDVTWQLMNPAYAAQAFFGMPDSVQLPDNLAQPSALRKGLVNLPDDWRTMDPGEAAQDVQISAFPERYNENRPRAEALLSQHWDSSPALTLPIQPGSGTIGADAVENQCIGSGGHDAILQKIKEYAWADYTPGNTAKKHAYQEAIDRASYKGSCDGVDCGAFVTAVMRESGADPQYNTDPEGNTTQQLDYLRRNSEPGGKYTRVTSKDQLQPGDIAIRQDGQFSSPSCNGQCFGHTFFFVGTAITEDAEGNPWTGGQSASASQCDRAPMASGTDTFELYEWYHLNTGAITEGSAGGGAGGGGGGSF